MSFDWTAVEQRERNKLDRDRELKDFLRVQQEEAKDRYSLAREPPSTRPPPRIQHPRTPPITPPMSAPSALPPQSTMPPHQSSLTYPSYTYDPPPSANTIPSSLTPYDPRITRLESDLTTGRTLLQHLHAKLDNLTQTLTATQSRLATLESSSSFTTSHSNDTDRVVVRHDEALSRVERDVGQVRAGLGDIAERVKAGEWSISEERGTIGNMREEVLRVRRILDGIVGRVGSLDGDVRSVERGVRDMTHSLESMSTSNETSLDSLLREISDLRSGLESELRSKTTFESSVRGMVGEIRRALQGVEVTFGDQIGSLRSENARNLDHERASRENDTNRLIEMLKSHSLSIRDQHTASIATLQSHLTSLDTSITTESAARAKLESTLRSEMEDSLRSLNGSLQNSIRDMSVQYGELKTHFTTAIKTLQESVLLVERTATQKSLQQDDVLRAEIGSRVALEQRVEGLPPELRGMIIEAEERVLGRVEECRELTKEESGRLEDELRKCEERVMTKERKEVDDLEVQITQLRRRVKDSDVETKERFKGVDAHIARVETEMSKEVEGIREEVEKVRGDMRRDCESVRERCEEVERNGEDVRKDVEGKLEGNRKMVDQNLEAVKRELSSRPTFHDVRHAEGRVADNIRDLRERIHQNEQTVVDVRSILGTKAGKEDLNNLETRCNDKFGMIGSRVEKCEGAIVEGREVMKFVATMDDLRKSIRNVNSVMDEVVQRGDETRGEVETLKSERPTRTEMNGLEKRLDERLEKVDQRVGKNEKDLAHFHTTQKDLATTKQVAEATSQLESRITTLSHSVSETRTHITTSQSALRTDLEQSLSDQTNALSVDIGALRKRMEEVDGSVESMKIRISDTDQALRERVNDQDRQTGEILREHDNKINAIRSDLSGRVQNVDQKATTLENRVETIEEGNRSAIEGVRGEMGKHHDTLIGHISGLRESSSGFVGRAEFDKWRGETVGGVKKLETRCDVLEVENGQVGRRVEEVDRDSRERDKELRGDVERVFNERGRESHVVRDALLRRVEDVDSRVAGEAKRVEGIEAEMWEQRLESDARRGQIERVERDVAGVKVDMKEFVRRGDVDGIVHGKLEGVQRRVGAMEKEVEGVRRDLEVAKVERGSSGGYAIGQHQFGTMATLPLPPQHATAVFPPSAVAQSQLNPGTFYKPAHLAFTTPTPTNDTVAPHQNPPSSPSPLRSTTPSRRIRTPPGSTAHTSQPTNFTTPAPLTTIPTTTQTTILHPAKSPPQQTTTTSTQTRAAIPAASISPPAAPSSLPPTTYVTTTTTTTAPSTPLPTSNRRRSSGNLLQTVKQAVTRSRTGSASNLLAPSSQQAVPAPVINERLERVADLAKGNEELRNGRGSISVPRKEF
ncbi:hypothetical protein HDV00_005807 [Rhizophlyctis rosea]|nr:hypothetical protein HDV00_005807 [Rhizophlyctis rosea]